MTINCVGRYKSNVVNLMLRKILFISKSVYFRKDLRNTRVDQLKMDTISTAENISLHSSEHYLYQADNSTTDSSDLTSQEWIWSHYLRSLIFGSITILTILGNALVIIAVATRSNLHSPTHLFIANLAVADFLVGILVLPILATYQLSETWYFGKNYCTAWVCVHFWLCSASILSVCAICLDRYIGVKYPLKHFRYMRSRNVAIITGVVWLIACGLSVIPIFAWPEPQEDPQICKINEQLGHVLVASVGILYIPTAIMIILYWQIYRAAICHLDSIRRGFMKACNKNQESSSNGLRIHIGSFSEQGESNSNGSGSDIRNVSAISQSNLIAVNYQRQAKTAKQLAIVVGAFIFSYVPFFTLFLIRSQDSTLVSIDVFNAFGWVRYFNSCLNPIIYAVMLPAFRRAFRDILRCKIK